MSHKCYNFCPPWWKCTCHKNRPIIKKSSYTTANDEWEIIEGKSLSDHFADLINNYTELSRKTGYDFFTVLQNNPYKTENTYSNEDGRYDYDCDFEVSYIDDKLDNLNELPDYSENDNLSESASDEEDGGEWFDVS